LNFIIGLFGFQISDLFLQELTFKFLTVHFKFILSISKLTKEIFHLILFFAVFSHKIIVLVHKSLILTSLVWVKLIKSEFHLLMDTG